MPEWWRRITARLRAQPAARAGARRLRPTCPVCEQPMERRGSNVWMCPDFPRCSGTIAADD